MSFIHLIESGTQPTLVLFHGTGGSESDLLQIGRDLMPGHRLLSPRGKVYEGGANRWFRRIAEGVFDEGSIKSEAAALGRFLTEHKTGSMYALGYSNGANIGAALMLLEPEVLDGLVMWRGMLPLVPDVSPQLNSKRILMLNGTDDQMGPVTSSRKLSAMFQEFGAEVDSVELTAGHSLTQADFTLTRDWLQSF